MALLFLTLFPTNVCFQCFHHPFRLLLLFLLYRNTSFSMLFLLIFLWHFRIHFNVFSFEKWDIFSNKHWLWVFHSTSEELWDRLSFDTITTREEEEEKKCGCRFSVRCDNHRTRNNVMNVKIQRSRGKAIALKLGLSASNESNPMSYRFDKTSSRDTMNERTSFATNTVWFKWFKLKELKLVFVVSRAYKARKAFG